MYETIRCDVNGGIATVTLNRPKALNAIDRVMADELADAVPRLGRDDVVRCIVITGAGDHFMAGGDISSFGSVAKKPAEERRAAMDDLIPRGHPVVAAMLGMDKPVIASVRGACAGYGLGLVLASDFVVASESSRFTMAYVRIGTSPDGASTYVLPRVVGRKRAMEIALLGDEFDAATALSWGVVSRVVSDGDLDATTAKLAGRLAGGAAGAIALTKRLLFASMTSSLEDQLVRETAAFVHCAGTADWVEGVTAFLEKRRPHYSGQ